MVGYAAVGGDADGGVAQATTGGNDSTRLPVHRQRRRQPDGRAAAIPNRASSSWSGMFALPAATIKVTLDRDVRGGNKTLIGVGANSGLTGAGLDLSYTDNIILQKPEDLRRSASARATRSPFCQSHHIWIDHCDLSSDRDDTTSGYDGLVDITHGSSYITVSWTQFHDHKDTTLVGHSADPTQVAEDAALSRHVSPQPVPQGQLGPAHPLWKRPRVQQSLPGRHRVRRGVGERGHRSGRSEHVRRRRGPADHDDVPGSDAGHDERGEQQLPARLPDRHHAAGDAADCSPTRTSPDAADSVSAIVSQCAGTGNDQLPAVSAAGVRSASRYSTFPLPPVIGDTVSAPTS